MIVRNKLNVGCPPVFSDLIVIKQVLQIGTKTALVKVDNFSSTDDSFIVPPSPQVTSLGVILHSMLCFEGHISINITPAQSIVYIHFLLLIALLFLYML